MCHTPVSDNQHQKEKMAEVKSIQNVLTTYQKAYGTEPLKAELSRFIISLETTSAPATARTRDTAKKDEGKDVEYIIRILNEPTNPHGILIKSEFYKVSGKNIIAARRCDPSLKGNTAGDRKVHYDFQIQLEDGEWLKCGTQRKPKI